MRETLLAPLSIVAGMMVLAFSDNFIALVAERVSVWQFHAMRAAMILPFIALTMALIGYGRTIWPARPAAVMTRSVFSITALLLYFASIPAIGISLSAAGLFTSPIFVMLISVLVFRESLGWRRLVALGLGFTGVCLVLEIGAQPIRLMALTPMLGGFFYALSIIWVRRYCQNETTGSLAFWNMAMFLIFGTVGVIATPWLAEAIGHFEGTDFAIKAIVLPSARELAIVLALGAGGAVGMIFLAYGYRVAPSTYSALFDYSFLVWVPIFAWLLHGDVLGLHAAAGMLLIVAAGALAISGIAAREAEPPAPAATRTDHA